MEKSDFFCLMDILKFNFFSLKTKFNYSNFFICCSAFYALSNAGKKLDLKVG